jgi:hypothetical protein
MRAIFNLIIAVVLLANAGSAWATGTYLDFDDFPVTTGSVPGDNESWAYSSRATNNTGYDESVKSGWISKTKRADGWNWFFDYGRIGACNTQYYYDAYSFLDIVPYGHTGNALRNVITGGRNASCTNLGTPVRNKETFQQSDIYTGVEKVGSMYLYFKKIDVLGTSRDYSGYLQARDANRLSFYIKLPEGWSNNTGHVNVANWTYYVGNFNWGSAHSGWHHYMNMSHRGGGWAHVSVDETTNGDNTQQPGGGNARYIPGFWHNCSQWYIATQPHAGNVTPPFAVLIDNIKWEYDSYAPQNNETVSNIAVMYVDRNKTWEISFNDKYKNSYSYATYEVRYSFDPITNENWAQATPVHTIRDVDRKIYERTDGKFQKAHPNTAYVWLPFKLTATDTDLLVPGKMVYFAVKDISQNAVTVDGVTTYKTGVQQILTEYPYNVGMDRGGRNFELYPQYLFDYDSFALGYPYIKRTYYQIAPNTTEPWPLLSVTEPEPVDPEPAPTTPTPRTRASFRATVR